MKTGLNVSQTVEGKWWIHGEDKPPHFGVLSFDPETGLELVVKLPQSRDVGEVIWDCLTKAEGGESTIPAIIHGADENDRPLTLFGCHSPGPSGSSGLETYRISSIACFRNIRSRSFGGEQFRGVRVRYSNFHQWMGKRIPGNLLEAFGKEYPDIVETLEPGVTLRIAISILPAVSLEEAKILFDHLVYFQFSENYRARSIRKDYVGVFTRLMCLLTGDRIFCDQITFFNRDPYEPSEGKLDSIELIQRCSGITRANRKSSSVGMLTCYQEIAQSFGAVVRKWFQVHKELEPVVELFLAVRSNRPATIESQFLFLAQALEVYHSRLPHFSSAEQAKDVHRAKIKEIICGAPKEHRKWLKEKLAFSNQKTLAARIDEVLKLHQTEVSMLTRGIEGFAEKVRHTRNYYTHYNQEHRRKKKIAEGAELMWITVVLEGLLEICLLKELGITGEPIRRVLNRIQDAKIIEADAAS